MKPADIFALAIRLLGLVFLYHAVLGFPQCFLSGVLFLHELLVIGAGLFCLFGAPPIQNLAYPQNSTIDRPTVTGPSPFTGTTRSCVSCGKSIPVDAKLCPHCGWTQPS